MSEPDLASSATESSASAASAAESRRRSITGAIVRRIPMTLGFIVVLLVIGVISQGLWRPVSEQPWFEDVAYGLPAFEAWRWWTPITGTFFVAQPLVFIPTILSFVGMAYLEYKRGWRITALYFVLGQLFAIFAAAAFLLFASLLPWPWAIALADQIDVGPSGGTMACIAAAVGLLVAPWRQRAWVVVFGYAAISLMLLGMLADVEHAFAILLVLAIDRSFRIQHSTVREQRLIAFVVLIGVGIIQIGTLLFPTHGPFGPTEPLEGPWIAVAIDTVVIIAVAHGLRRGRLWAWIAMIIWTGFNVLSAVALITLFSVFLPALDGMLPDNAALDAATAVLWIAFLVYLIVTRRAFRTRRGKPLAPEAQRPKVAEVRELIQREGGGTLSWMATWEDLRYFRTSTGIVPFQLHAGTAIALADPLGPPSGVAASVEEFADAAVRAGAIPCFFSAGRLTHDAMPEGWRSLIIADDTIVDLEGLTFQGKAWAKIRQSFSRAEREGMTFRLTTWDEISWGVRQQLRAISESWVGDKGLPEMRFTLGRLQEANDPEVRLALAISPEGDVDGFLSWLPVFGPGGERRGWTLDLMRRREGGFAYVMEYLIGSSAKAFSEEGAKILSLSGAPLAHEATPDEGLVANLLGSLSGALEPVYGFKSLHQFKMKFNPRFEPIYLLYRDEADFRGIAMGLTRAFLPDATLGQFAAAGVELLRGEKH